MANYQNYSCNKKLFNTIFHIPKIKIFTENILANNDVETLNSNISSNVYKIRQNGKKFLP